MTPLISLEPIQGIALQGSFDPSNLPMECFYSQKAHDCLYASFQSHLSRSRVLLNFVPFRTLHSSPFSKRKGGRPCLTYGSYYPILVHMFHTNMHIVSPRCSFWVTMFDQSFQITSFLVRCVFDMPRLDACLPSFLPKVQSLIPRKLISILALYGVPREFLTYIPLATFLTHSFYLCSHCTKIRQSITHFVHAILFGEQFDIGQVIIDTIFRIKPLKVRHDVTKLDLTIPLVY